MNEANSSVRRSRLLRLAPWLVALLALGGIYASYRLAMRHGVNKRLDAIRAQGLPATAAELDQWYVRVPEAENAATIYLQAFAKLQSPSAQLQRHLPLAGQTNLPPSGLAIPPEQRDAMAAYVASNAEALPLLAQAATRSRCRYPVDLSKGYAADLTHLQQVRSSARLLVLAAVLAADRGEAAVAVGHLQDLLALERSLKTEPWLVSQLVRVSCGASGAIGVEQAVNRTSLDPGQLAMLQAGFAAAEDPNLLWHVLVGEQTLGSQVLSFGAAETVAILGSDGLLERWLIRLHALAGLKDLSVQNLLRAHGQYLAISRRPAPKCLADSKALTARIEQLPVVSLYEKMFLASLDRVFVKGATHTARARVIQAGLAAERYRLATGQLPRQLAELVPSQLAAMPIDPFDGLPLRCTPLPAGLVVYSIGENLIDDGGDSRGQPSPDITFTIQKNQAQP